MFGRKLPAKERLVYYLRTIPDTAPHQKKLFRRLALFAIFFSSFGLNAQIFVQQYFYTGAIQNFTVPGCVSTMTIEARGAQGGFDGGKGALISGVVTVTPGQVLKILVGKAGTPGQNFTGNGGGGGTFVTDNLNNPIMIGGGGGGTGQSGANGGYPNIGGSVFQNGEQGQTGGAGGVNGTGGAAIFLTPIWNAAGGGGLTGNGGGGGNSFGGGSFVSGGAGGNSTGGYGGGGGSNTFVFGCNMSPQGGGGGGGYSGGGGGGGGAGVCNGAGGGGGSYNGGTGQLNIPAYQTGNGLVTISYGSMVNITANPSYVCSGSSTTLTITGPVSQTWAVNGTTTNTVVVSPIFNTTYPVNITPPQGCNVLLASITVSVYNLPVLGITSTTGCPSGPANLSATGAVNYTWNPGNAQGSPVTVSPSVQTVYTLTGMDALGCVNTKTFTQGVFPTPTITANSATVCMGAPFAIIPTGAMAYTWNPGNLPGVVTGVAMSPSTYTVTGVSALGCTANATASVSIYTPPPPPLSFTSSGISCASLGSATVAAPSGTGPFNYTWTPTGQLGPMVSGLSPGVYTLSMFDISIGCISIATTTFVSVIPFAGNLNTTSSLSCNGINTGTANYTNLTGGSPNPNYVWTDGATSYNIPNPSSLGPGTWTVTVTDALSGCAINNTFVITQPPALTLAIAASSPTGCTGTGVVLSSTLSGGVPPYQFSWVNGASASTYSANPSMAGSYVYTLNAEDFNNCIASDTIRIDFATTPTLSISNVSICPLTAGMLAVSGASSYLWDNSTTGSQLFANPASTTGYTVWGSSLGCTAAATASIIIHGLPVPAPTYNGPLCNAETLQLDCMPGAIAYSWTGPGGFSATTQSPGITSVNAAHAGVYNVTVTAATSCTAAASTLVVVNPTPTLSATGSTACTSQALSLSGSAGAGSTYLWTGPQNFTSGLQNFTQASPALNQSGTYTLLVTSADGCTNTATALVDIIPPPSLTLSLSGSTLCAQPFNGSSNSMILTAAGAASYSIITPPHINNSNPSGPSSAFAPLPPYTPGIATAIVIGSNGICTNTFQASFNVIPNPVVTVSSPTAVVCSGQSFSYTAQGADNYAWVANTGSMSISSQGSVAVITPTTTGIFSVFGSSGGCNSSSALSSLVVYPIPTTTVAAHSVTICLGSPTLLVAGGSSNSFTWSPAIGLNAVAGNSVLASPAANQQYTVTGSANNCTSSTTLNIKVLGLPSATIIQAKSTACIYDTILLSGSGGNRYKWTGPYDLEMYGQTISFVAANFARTGIYTLTVIDTNGCANTATTGITVYEMPQARLSGVAFGCAPFCPDLRIQQAVGSTGLVTTSWETGGQMLQGGNFTTCLEAPGNHIIKGTFKDNVAGCSNTQTFVVTVLPVPKANFSWEPEKPLEKADWVQFSNLSTGPRQEQWNWYFIDNNGPAFAYENPGMNFEFSGIYPVALVVRNNYGCTDTIVKSITVAPDFNIYIPNTFTPNGDLNNDVFLPIVRNASQYHMQIFNRWGALMFSTTNLNDGWNGTYLNKECKEEVYVYLIRLTTIDGEEKEFKGGVMLMR